MKYGRRPIQLDCIVFCHSLNMLESCPAVLYLLFVVEWNHTGDWAKDLFLHQPRIVRDIGNDDRRLKISLKIPQETEHCEQRWYSYARPTIYTHSDDSATALQWHIEGLIS